MNMFIQNSQQSILALSFGTYTAAHLSKREGNDSLVRQVAFAS